MFKGVLGGTFLFVGWFWFFINVLHATITAISLFCSISSERLVKIGHQALSFRDTKFTAVQCVWQRSLFF